MLCTSAAAVVLRTYRTDAICFALDRSVLEGAEPLVSTVVERTMTVLQGGGKGRDDFSVLVRKALCFFLALWMGVAVAGFVAGYC